MSQTLEVTRGQTIKYLGDPKDLNVTPKEGDDNIFIVEYPDQPRVSMSFKVGEVESKRVIDIEPPAITANYVQVGDIQPLPGCVEYTLTHNGPKDGKYHVYSGEDRKASFSNIGTGYPVGGNDINVGIGNSNITLDPNVVGGSQTWTDGTGGYQYPTIENPTFVYPYIWPWAPQWNQPTYTYSIPPADLTFEDLRLGEKINVSFDDISSESYRVYHYPGEEVIVIDKPIALAVYYTGFLGIHLKAMRLSFL